ncbi:DUF418 domain-containing protein [Spirosoma utsteinense]|uniref:DUF418 domain-containing protein n=1 Tax=Spirosoma utsteinense TaxID=2585773 RepID=A0ABR6WAA8_9BACT|nr:DUF418 domain-containing protein [Spirosoma utsteinense]MBC3787972.1 hypothetical protein [Spirosoma utsteinense]MBC3793123.1 hypothetical protein [Spirosoma utsteinense]
MEANPVFPITSDTSVSGLTATLPADYQEGVQAQAAPRPVAKADRIQTIDLIRGVALLGILMMNIPGFGFLASGFNTLLNNPTGADFYTFAVVGVAFEGTMRGLFSMLFGAGMVLFTQNKREQANGPTVAEYYYRRLLWLVLFGVINAYVLLWRGDILFFYGLCGMLLYPFRRIKGVWLIGLAVLCMGFNSIRSEIWYGELRENRAGYLEAKSQEKAHKKLTDKQKEAKTAWERFEKNFKPDPKKDTKELTNMRGGYGTVFMHLLPENSASEIYYTYYGSWDMLLMMFLGMALLGWGFFSNKLPTSTYVVTLLIGYGIGLPISWFYVASQVDWSQHPGQIVDNYRTIPFQVYDIRRVLLALGHASLVLLVYRSQLVPWLMRALTAVGQMAFTNYLMQSIICTLIFHGYGLGYYGKLSYYELYYVVAGVWVFQLILSPIWLQYFLFGPFEWLWRSLTYWQLQPMRRTISAT